ncbi:MAG: response regulator transcription factor [bacterium]|nr:response regulator transcription factor [bacterium]
MNNHIYIFYLLISFCAGMVFLTPSLLWYLKNNKNFKYYQNYQYFFPFFFAFTAIIFSHSIHLYVSSNMPDAGFYSLIILVIVQVIGIHLFSLFLALWVHNFFQVKYKKFLDTFILIATVSSLIAILTIFFTFYIGKEPSGKQIISFPTTYIFNTIFSIIIAYGSLNGIIYYRKMDDPLLKRMVSVYVFPTGLILLAIYIGSFIKGSPVATELETIKGYLLPAFYLAWTFLGAYYCIRYYYPLPLLGEENSTEKKAGQEFSPEDFVKEYDLTAREGEIVELLIRGCSNNEISEELSISLPTVKTHIHNIFKKTSCGSRTELLSIVFQGM